MTNYVHHLSNDEAAAINKAHQRFQNKPFIDKRISESSCNSTDIEHR